MSDISIFEWKEHQFKVLQDEQGDYFFRGEDIARYFGLTTPIPTVKKNEFAGFQLTDLMAIAVEKAAEDSSNNSRLATKILDFVSAAMRNGYITATIERLYHACRIYVAWATERTSFSKNTEKVYLIGCEENKTMKIGRSKNPKSRLVNVQNGNPYRLEVLSTVEGGAKLENELHKEFNHLRLEGEWFKWSQEIIDKFNCLSAH